MWSIAEFYISNVTISKTEKFKPSYDMVWTESTTGLWTRHLIPDLTQVSTGHGCFQDYLHSIRKVPSSQCTHYGDTAEYIYMPKMGTNQARVLGQVDREVTPENLAETMLEGETSWKSLKDLANNIMQAREDDEKRREEEQQYRRHEGGGGQSRK